MQRRDLPLLREELSLHQGPVQADGSPSWTLHDPSINRFYQLGWASFEMLSRWSAGSVTALLAAVNAETALQLTADDVDALIGFLSRHQLLQVACAEQSQALWRMQQASRPGRAMWLLKNYLFFRVPLLRPEAMLSRLLPWCRWLFVPRFWWGMGAMLLTALVLVSQRWDAFTHTFSAYGGWWAAIGIGLSLALAKVLHEMGHALTARHFGCRVPAMGVAFLVMVPVLYTDTNDAWKLQSRRARLLIGAAGMLAELTLAVWATLLWCFLPDGPLRAGVFLLASTTWVATVLVNASPFMRFDGYFLLADYLGLPNLHSRTFALALWQLRRFLLCLDDPPPEHFPTVRRNGLILFAWATWLYRLVVFLSIAFLVYHFFFKLLGLLLLCVELGWFIVRPIVGELRVWWGRRAELRWQTETRRSTAMLGALLLLLAIPWSSGVSSPAVLGAAQSQGLYAPVAATVEDVMVRDGQVVQPGQVLAQLRSPALDAQLALADVREQAMKWQLAQQAFSTELQQQGTALHKQWQAAREQLNGLRQQQARLVMRAPFAGRVVDINEALHAGATMAEGEHLLDIAGLTGAKVEALVDEASISSIQTGNTASFVADNGGRAAINCRVGKVDRLNLSVLDQPLLASSYGGPIATELRDHGPKPLAAWFRVRLEKCDAVAAPAMEMAGTARIQGTRYSFLGRMVTRLLGEIQRESGM